MISFLISAEISSKALLVFNGEKKTFFSVTYFVPFVFKRSVSTNKSTYCAAMSTCLTLCQSIFEVSFYVKAKVPIHKNRVFDILLSGPAMNHWMTDKHAGKWVQGYLRK
jgi:hypothetical protein